MTSEPPKKPAKKTAKAVAKKPAKKATARKTVTAKAEPPTVSQQEVDQWERDDEQVELTSEAQGVVEAVSSQLDEVISKARAAGIPMLFGSCTVSLHFEFEDASDPIEAVQKAINGIVNEGLTRWTWIVRDETSDDLHAVADGRIVPLEAARVGP